MSCARAGIEIRTETTVKEITERDVTLSDGERIPARTVVWTAGVKPSPAVGKLGLPLDRGGRVVVDRTMRVEGSRARVGDRRLRRGARSAQGKGSRAPRPHSTRSARGGWWLATWSRRSATGRVRPFRYRTKGVVAELGDTEAVALTLGVRWRGLPAWFIARTYHLLLMPGMGRKLRLLMDWNVALLFGRDTSAPGRLGSPTPLSGARIPTLITQARRPGVS